VKSTVVRGAGTSERASLPSLVLDSERMLSLSLSLRIELCNRRFILFKKKRDLSLSVLEADVM
jgi:hypothetical protein